MPFKTDKRMRLTVSLTMISVILGLMLSMQYKNMRVTADAQAKLPQTDPKAQYTAEQLDRIKDENKGLEEDIEKLNKQLHGLEKQAGDVDKNLAPEIRDDLTKYKIMAGLLAVKGPGITFTVDDNKKDIPADKDVLLYITHDSDLRMIVNELLIAGAEAVSINGQRITTTTGIVCIGTMVKVNNQRITTPFVFNAIGDPKNMINALETRGGVIEVLTRPENGRYLTITPPKQSPSITIPGYAGDFNGLKK
ncbi:DUF881 domain-containing protein [Tumebacillus flagellatus]|uniref:Division initiation protein n=1 Tax=Tumebacillus flagellatus TaxID=1157490 RepID=A0A074LM57_9BACL|nr:DUF881 domain-containing protein [Tumebacillus flagellatus]KEO83176.1 hypothetical protein EL26_10805 [Tumebacillus flagellatus]